MELVQLSIRQPVSTFSAVIMIILFGVIGLNRLPVQLTPDVEAPKISVRTNWAGATPYEIEKEIIEEQEDVLKSVSSLTVMESSSFNDYGTISLTFKVGTDTMMPWCGSPTSSTKYPAIRKTPGNRLSIHPARKTHR